MQKIQIIFDRNWEGNKGVINNYQTDKDVENFLWSLSPVFKSLSEN